MEYFPHRKFVKQYKKLQISVQKKCDMQLLLFAENPFDKSLSNHPLHGKYQGYHSIDITGDIRAVYQYVDENVVLFVRIGTHSELYE
jgi:addiction module RelE/StbE family toxin